jgi:hypothetical protein
MQADAERGVIELAELVLDRVRRVVRRDGVDDARVYSRDQRRRSASVRNGGLIFALVS